MNNYVKSTEKTEVNENLIHTHSEQKAKGFLGGVQFTFSITLFGLKMHGTVVRESYTPRSVPPGISSTHLAHTQLP